MGGEWIHVWLSPFAIHLSQHCLLINYTPIQNKKLKKKKDSVLSLQGVQFQSLVRKQTSYSLRSTTKKIQITVKKKKKKDDTLYSCYFIHPMSN